MENIHARRRAPYIGYDIRMHKPRILMCEPRHYHVEYVINPWMKGNVDAVSPARARVQWQALRATLARHAEVVEVPPAPELPDMVFTANAGTVCGERVVVSRFRHRERQGEAVLFAKWFREHGFEVMELPEGIDYEGAGDSLLDRGGDWIWAGHGQRTDIESHGPVAEWLGRELVSLELVDPLFYHLDTCMCPLTGGWVMYYPAAFDAAAIAEIERRVPPGRRIVVDDEDARRFACNAVNVGRVVVMNRASDALRGRLTDAGFELQEVDLGEFIKAGGSAKCMTLKLDEPDAAAAARAAG